MDFIKVAAWCFCFLGLSQAGIVATNYSPVVSSVYSSYDPNVFKASPAVTKTITPVYSSGPYYKSVVTTHESKHKFSDGSQHASFSKTLDTSNDGVIVTQSLPSINSIPAIHSANSVYHDTHTYSNSHPIVYNAPVLTKTITPILKKTEIVTPALTTHFAPIISSPIVTKSISTPIVYSSPVVTKTVTPILNKAVLTPTVIHAPVKTGIAYSPTPFVAHTSFTGLGSSYSW